MVTTSTTPAIIGLPHIRPAKFVPRSLLTTPGRYDPRPGGGPPRPARMLVDHAVPVVHDPYVLSGMSH
jgi:hypothetical protein